MEGIIRAEEGAEPSSSVVCLVPALGGEFYSVVGDGLVDIAVL
jgi:hypothetical protein